LDIERSYLIHHAVGKGSFGTVYRATQQGAGGFSKVVAIKILNPEMEGWEDVAARLRDEAKILGLFRHRAVLHVDGLYQIDGRWSVVMEYVPGSALYRVLRARETLPLGAALEMVSELASALHVAYASQGPEGPLKIIHRDIKPSNIQLSTAGEVKLLDWGVARAEFEARESETKSMLMGSRGYMAPERLQSIDTPAGDIYALGVVLGESLSGQRFGKTFFTEAKHEQHIEACLQTVAREVGPDFEAVKPLLERMLAYDHQARITAKEIEREIRNLRGVVPAPWLAEWAETTLVSLVEQQKVEMGDAELNGSTLHERTEPMATDEIPRAPAHTAESTLTPARSIGAIATLAVIGGLALIGFLVVVAALLFVGNGLMAP